MSWQRGKLPVFVFFCQTAFILIFAFTAKYGPTSDPKNTENLQSAVKSYYPIYQDVNTMIFVGFGFLMTFLKRYGYSAVGLNFLVASFVIQWTTIIRGFLHVDVIAGERFKIYIPEMMSAAFGAAGVLISFGAVLGKVSPLQILVMALIETVFVQVNEWICLEKFHVVDAGESVLIHAFGAYFGIAVARVLYTEEAETSKKEGTVYHSDLFSMIGTIFLWMYWPSFNSGSAEGDEQHRAILNTYLALISSCVVTFAVSAMFNKQGKFQMEHIQNGTLAGGVAIGALANLPVQPWVALLVGALGAILTVFGFKYITPCLTKLKFHDTCGVNNLHGMPGLMAGIGGAIAAAVATEENYGASLYEIYAARVPIPSLPENSTATPEPVPEVEGLGRTAQTQAIFQVYAMLLTLGVSIVGGLFTGAILRMNVWDNPKDESLYDDGDFWELPEDGVPEVAVETKPSLDSYRENIDTKM